MLLKVVRTPRLGRAVPTSIKLLNNSNGRRQQALKWLRDSRENEPRYCGGGNIKNFLTGCYSCVQSALARTAQKMFALGFRSLDG
jgi:hypothetical protein